MRLVEAMKTPYSVSSWPVGSAHARRQQQLPRPNSWPGLVDRVPYGGLRGEATIMNIDSFDIEELTNMVRRLRRSVSRLDYCRMLLNSERRRVRATQARIAADNLRTLVDYCYARRAFLHAQLKGDEEAARLRAIRVRLIYRALPTKMQWVTP